MSLTQRYHSRLAEEGFDPDPEQLTAILALDQVADAVQQPVPRGWASWFKPAAAPAKGLYLWGGVGRGKTWLMDLFYESLPIQEKGRFHFHRFMQLVHAELGRIKGQANPLDIVAARMSKDWRMLCLDEFNVVDIGDAVILAGLLRSLFAQGIVLVTTSNVVPDGLYRDGIQRASFLPAIDLLNRCTNVIHVGGDRDYRQEVLEQARIYHAGLGAATDKALYAEFHRLAGGSIQRDGALDINGRSMPYRYHAGDMTWFDFEALCGPPRSQNDYIELSRCQHTIFVSDIPVMGASRDDRTRRFIFLIDEFYDRRVKLIVSAEASANRLYIGERLAFEFQRTLSRLTEMQSPSYMNSHHLG